MTFAQMRAAVAEVQSRTNSPFGVNLRADQVDIADRISFLLEVGIPVVSFASPPRPEMIGALRDRGAFVICTIGAPRHAEKVTDMGVDAVIAQGAEGGGHTGQIPTSLLLPKVVDLVGDRVIVLGAGGFFDGRGLVSALAYGADGVAMGTRFLLTRESRVPDQVKEIYLKTLPTGTVVTRRVDGASQRLIRTEVVDKLEAAGRLTALRRSALNALRFAHQTGSPLRHLLEEGLSMKRQSDLNWAQVIMAANAPMMTKAALVEGRTDVGIMPTGQVTGLLDDLPSVAEVLRRVVEEANATLTRLGAGQRSARESGQAR
jgi:NAD(P)H-dependent flavin oxidoreductase YrpB (nitropropane dioxygenase family)